MPWQKGQSGNPGGRPKNKWREHFDAVIAADTKKHKQSIFEHAIEQARKDNTLLAQILKKMLPNLKAIEAKTETESPFRLIIDMRPESPKPEQDKNAKKKANNNKG